MKNLVCEKKRQNYVMYMIIYCEQYSLCSQKYLLWLRLSLKEWAKSAKIYNEFYKNYEFKGVKSILIKFKRKECVRINYIFL